MAVILLAAAVVGLVILLALQLDPETIKFLIRLLALQYFRLSPLR